MGFVVCMRKKFSFVRGGGGASHKNEGEKGGHMKCCGKTLK